MEENKEKNGLKNLLKKEVIISLVLGLLLGMLIMFFANGGLAVKVSGKIITSKKLYNKMRDYYSIGLVLEDVDSQILNKKYKLTEDETNELKETADNYIKQYENYGYTQEAFLQENGFKDYDAFINYLSVDYKRTLYLYDYLETKLEKDAVKNYYEANAFPKVNTKHMLVKTSDNVTDEQALALANEIIGRLNAGEEFDTLKGEYTEKYDYVITEDLGAIGAFDNIEQAYIDGMKELEAGKYSTTPVKTSYGYHVIYCIEKDDSVKDVKEITSKEKTAIVGKLAKDAELDMDETTYYQSLIQMRKDAHLKFFDKELKAKYDEYCEQYK